MQVILVVFGIVLTIYGIYEIIYSGRNHFDSNKLYQSIEEQNLMKEHPHSIVLIKDTFNQHTNRYLLYYDSRWNCKLFLNYSTITSGIKEVEANISKHLQMELKVADYDIKGAYEFEKVHEKFSISSQENKCYRHRFYKYVISNFSENLKRDCFEIDGKKFYWMSIAEMECDSRIMEVNSDIVNMVKQQDIK